MRRLLARYGLPTATFHAKVGGFEVDFLFDGTKVVLECQGWRYHGLQREQWLFDQRREAVLTSLGYIVLKETWTEVVHRPADVAARLKASLRQWAPHLFAA